MRRVTKLGTRGSCGTETTPVRTRIIGLTVWVSVLAIGLFGVPVAVAVYKYAIQDHRGNLARVARAAAITVAEEVYDGERIEDAYRHGSVVVAVYDENAPG